MLAYITELNYWCNKFVANRRGTANAAKSFVHFGSNLERTIYMVRDNCYRDGDWIGYYLSLGTGEEVRRQYLSLSRDLLYPSSVGKRRVKRSVGALIKHLENNMSASASG